MPTCTPPAAFLAPGTPSDLRRQFVADIRSRFRPIRGRVRHFVAERDGFGLRSDARTARLQDAGDEDLPDDWPDPPEAIPGFESNAAKTDAFVRWLREALREGVLEPVETGDTIRLRQARGQDRRGVLQRWSHWTASYVLGALFDSWDVAGSRLRVRGGTIAPTALPDDPDLPGAFDIGVRPELLQALYVRAYEGLEAVVDDAAEQQVRETLTEGFAEGINPREMADRLTKDIRGLQRRRAEAHARTTVMHVRTQGALNRYQEAGETVVSHVEIADANDARVCPFCRRLDGVEMTIGEMQGTHVLWRGDIYRLASPSHVNGRCTPLPSVGASPPTEPLADRVPGTILTRTASPHALSQ